MPLTMESGVVVEGIVLARIITDEETPITYNFNTSEEAQIKPTVEKGIDKVKRNKNTILGRVKTEDLVSGLEISLKDSLLMPNVISVVDGGAITGTGDTTKYTAPVAGSPVTRKSFKLELYSQSLDTDGSVLRYVKFVFNGCKGTPVEYQLKEGDFFVPELKLISSPAAGIAPYSWEYVTALPTT